MLKVTNSNTRTTRTLELYDITRRPCFLTIFFIRRPVREVIQSTKRSIEDDSGSSEEEDPTQIPCKKKATSQRYRWNSEMDKQLLKNLANVKIVYKFKGIDFESNLIKANGKTSLGKSKL